VKHNISKADNASFLYLFKNLLSERQAAKTAAVRSCLLFVKIKPYLMRFLKRRRYFAAYQ